MHGVGLLLFVCVDSSCCCLLEHLPETGVCVCVVPAAAAAGMALNKAGFMIVGDSVRVGQRVRFMVRPQIDHLSGATQGGATHDTLLSPVTT